MSEKIFRFLDRETPATPCLVVDLDIVRSRYAEMQAALPQACIHYAVKANPAPEILALLATLGSRFDAAGINEIRSCIAAGAGADRISFGSTIKKASDIREAVRLGVRSFAFDCREELAKIADAAPGARVFCRIRTSGAGAEWPLSNKFGCPPKDAAGLLRAARSHGLRPAGISFHVGSQQTDPERWDPAIGDAAATFAALTESGIDLPEINIGGGFPARYRTAIPDLAEYGRAIDAAMARHFGNRQPALIVEPGRALVGDAGVIRSEVILVSRRCESDPARWVYLDIGKFGGLPETDGERICYRLRTPRDGEPTEPVILAGPTCEGVDILYQNSGYRLPASLESGDKVDVLAAGAYTASYSAVAFNGIDPLPQHFV